MTFDDEPSRASRSRSRATASRPRPRPTPTAGGPSACPRRAKYEITLDEDTLPEGVVVEDGQATVTAEFGLTNRKAVNFFLGEGERVTTDFGAQCSIRVVNGLNFGLLLALAAIGLSLIFGTTGLSNFAHAEMVTFGADDGARPSASNFACPSGSRSSSRIVLGAALGWTSTPRSGSRCARGVGLIQLMIVSIGLSLAMRYTYQFFYGGTT